MSILFEVNILRDTNSLKNSNDFQRVLKKGTWFAGDFMSIYILPNKEKINMLGIAVGKKSLSSFQR